MRYEKSVLLMSLLSIYAAPSFAQSNADYSKTPAEHEVDSAHDTAENDPSNPNTSITLRKPIPQDHLFVFSVNRRLKRNVGPSFNEMLKIKPEEVKSSLTDSTLTELFKIHQYRYTPKKEYGPTTVNSDHEYKGISDRAHGYCWGYSTLVRFFTTLAFFEPNLPRNENFEFYKKKIDQIIRGEATVIPGYANLREFSLDPRVEFYLKLNAMELWKTRAVRAASFPIFKNADKSMSSKEVDTILGELENKIARGELPKIMFSSLIPSEKILGMNTDIHVVLAYRVERLPEKRAKIHLWDINFYTETLEKSPKFLEITPEGGILYAPWYEPSKTYAKGSDLVARVSIAPEDDVENVQMLKSLKKFCSNQETRSFCKMGLTN